VCLHRATPRSAYKLSSTPPDLLDPSVLWPASIFSVCRTNMDLVLGDFCLSCDRQTNGTAFCSSACRLTQLDHFTQPESTPSSYSSHNDTTSMTAVTQRPTLSLSNTGFYLPPAYDFSIHRTSSSNSLSTSSSSRPHSPKLSEQAQNDLKDYVGSFDQTRTLRRRVSMQSNEDVKAHWRS
jgi:hypothetical protein